MKERCLEVTFRRGRAIAAYYYLPRENTHKSAPRRRPGDPELHRAMAALWTTSRRLTPRRFPAGVYRHRSIEDMDRERDAWDREFVQTLRRERRTKSPTR